MKSEIYYEIIDIESVLDVRPTSNNMHARNANIKNDVFDVCATYLRQTSPLMQ